MLFRNSLFLSPSHFQFHDPSGQIHLLLDLRFRGSVLFIYLPSLSLVRSISLIISISRHIYAIPYPLHSRGFIQITMATRSRCNQLPTDQDLDSFHQLRSTHLHIRPLSLKGYGQPALGRKAPSSGEVTPRSASFASSGQSPRIPGPKKPPV